MSDQSWFKIGHVTHPQQRSGCTAIVFNHLVPAAVDARGGAPGTRETTLLEPGNVGMLDAILLSGGSAFGLRATDGVMRFLAENGRGFETRFGNVPLVSSAIIFDLGVGSAYHPTANDGYSAAEGAISDTTVTGAVGAGCGASVAKLGGNGLPSGLGWAQLHLDEFTVSAIVVLNAVGDVRNPNNGAWLARNDGPDCRDLALGGLQRADPLENTTIGAVLIDGALDRRTLTRACISAQAALARCTIPAHTVLDGDTFYAASSNSGQPTVMQTLAITSAVEVAVEQAIISIFA